jgi:hypothetical protein
MSAEPARATLIDGKAFSVDLVDRVAAVHPERIFQKSIASQALILMNLKEVTL